MTLRAAAEQALDTLEHVQAHIGRYDPPVVTTIARAMQPTIDALRAALAAEQPQRIACVCGEPWRLGVVHRAGGPCYVAEQPQPEADERAENEALRREMADILTRTANALRGPPGPREAWGWADLPERAEAAIAAITTMTLAAQYAAAPPPAAPEPSEAEVAAAMASLHRDMEPAAWPSEDEVTDALRAAAAARNTNPA